MLDCLIGTKEKSIHDYTFKVTLENKPNDSVHLELKKKFDTFQIFIEPIGDGPSAIFLIGKRDNNLYGQVVRTLGIKDKNDNNLDMSWPVNGNPQLYYRPLMPGTLPNLEYTIRVIGL